MSTTTTNYGLIKPDTTDPILIGQLNDNADIIDATLKSLSDVLDVAKLGIKYKGEVNYYSNLPASGNEIGDAYTVKYAGSSGTTPDGTEYVWGTVSGTNQWINFSKDSYTKAEVDALLSLKANIADIPTPSTAAPAMDGTAAAGTSTDYARADHVHPSDTSRASATSEAEDRAALVEIVDSGAKNHINNTLTSGTTPSGNISYTVNTDKSITIIGGTATANADIVIPFSVNTSGTYVLTGGAAGGGSTTYKAQIALYPSMEGVAEVYGNTFKEAALTAGIDYAFRFRVYSGKTVPDCTIYPMVCTKAAWDISQTYQPYRPSYQELYEMVKALQANQ